MVYPALDPFTDVDALETLEEEVVTLAAHLHAGTYRLLTLIAEFDRRRGWELGGHRSCAHWLSFRTGIDLGAAREKVRAARELEGLPLTSAAMARGELSFSQVRAITRVADAHTEGDLLELALGCTTAQLERMVRAFRKGTRKEEAELGRIRQEERSFSVFPGDDGMYVVKGRLTPEVGALLMRAVEAASDALFREEGVMDVTNGSAETSRPASDSLKRAAQRRADALALMAERAMEAGFREGPVSGTRAARYQVVLHVDEDTLADPKPLWGEPPEPGRSELEDGTRVSPDTSRRISCDCAVVRVVHGREGDDPPPDGIRPYSNGPILDIGRRTRSIPPALRRALEVRDRGCRFPGCDSRFTDAHHVTHWADGGETSLTNTLLLCRAHHALVHEGGWRVDWWGEGRPAFFDPRGGMHFEGGWKWPEGIKDGSAEPSGQGEAAVVAPETTPRDRRACAGETLVRDNRERGVIPGASTECPSALAAGSCRYYR